jgi:hypothetical protein
MATQPTPGATEPFPLIWPPVDLMDKVVFTYVDWCEDAAAASDAYARWSEAPTGEEDLCFAAYCAALDQEQSAAASYALALEDLNRAMRSADAALDR